MSIKCKNINISLLKRPVSPPSGFYLKNLEGFNIRKSINIIYYINRIKEKKSHMTSLEMDVI